MSPPKRNRVSRICQYCDNGFEVKPSEIAKGGGKYCRRKCKYNGITAERTCLVRCAYCEVEIRATRWDLANQRGKYCGRKCMGLDRQGERNPAYRHGNAYDPHPLEFNKTLKKHIRERDKVCQLCECHPVSRQALDVHHIDYDKMNNCEDNLIALCRSCHQTTSFKRDSWMQVLSGIHNSTSASG